jgi:hypothetical protein
MAKEVHHEMDTPRMRPISEMSASDQKKNGKVTSKIRSRTGF